MPRSPFTRRIHRSRSPKTRTTLHKSEQMIIGTKRGGYSIYKGRGWNSALWRDGEAIRSDNFPTKQEAVRYAIQRARNAGGFTKRDVKPAQRMVDAQDLTNRALQTGIALRAISVIDRVA